jgi:hypothetical protein
MSHNTDYLQGYVDALKALSARIDNVILDALAKAERDAENPALKSFSGGQRIALLVTGERIARTTTELVKEVMA